MKKSAFIILITGLVVAACNNEQANKKNDVVRDSLEVANKQSDSTVNTYLSSFVDIERRLDSISEKQKSIYIKSEKPSEPKTLVINEINTEIASINSLLVKNKETIAQLNYQLKASGTKNEKLEQAIKSLNDLLTQKQKELSNLNTKLNNYSAQIVVLYTDIYILNAENADQAEIISEQTKALHKAYYVVGTLSDLEKGKVIDKKGGVLGMGKTPELSNDFNARKFTEIDFTETLSIPINSKSVQIVTSHPTNSYKLVKENGVIKSLTITNAEEFWKASKYLIIIKEA